MTDNEIIKALECHASHKDECDNCPNAEISSTVCSEITAEKALDLINRQKTTIRDLTYKVDLLETSLENMITGATIAIDVERAEAVREFAEKLKSMLSFGRYTSYEQIDNLVKEMGCNDG